MYEIFYNLRAEPFKLSPDHRFCYEHKGYAKARAYMAYAFLRAEGFVMVTGRPGTGKTTLIGDLIESLAKDNVTTANLVCTQLQADDLLKSVAYSFGVGSGNTDKAELLQRLNELFHKWHRDGHRALLIVDEAQNLSLTAMEELRLLTNIQVDGQPLLQIFLLGQPELRDMILAPEMEQVHQRIVAASHLEALELDETEAYVRHRLEAVGWSGDPAVSKAIFPLIYKFSEGVPRRINLICSRLFLYGGVEQRHEIGVQDVRVVISELQGEHLAAGNKLVEADFEVEDEFEQVVVAAVAPLVESSAEVAMETPLKPPLEVSTHEVSNESLGSPVSKSAGDRHSQETPSVESDISRVSGSDSSAARNEPDEVVSVEEKILPPEPQDAQPAVGAARRQTKSRVVSVAAILMIIIMSACIFLGVQAIRGGGAGDWQSELQALWGRVVGAQSASGDEGLGRAFEIDEVGQGESQGRREGRSTPQGTATGQIVGSVPLEDEITVSKEAVAPTELTVSSDTPLPEVEVLPEKEQISFVTFAFDSVDVSLESLGTLDRVAAIMGQSPNSVASIIGFSDTQGEAAYNLILSRQRANAVEQYLVSKGVESHRLQVEGRGVRHDFADAEISGAGVEDEVFRIVQIRISDGSATISDK